MTKYNIKDVLENDNASIIQALYIQSSNGKNTVEGYVVLNVIEKTELQRLLFLKELVKSGIDLERKIEIIKGFSLAKTKNWTVVDDIIHNHKKYDSTDHFEVMWLDEKESASNYRGSIGHKITRRKGIVLSYPNEL